MRTRFLARLTNQEVEDYLERNDIIFVPVGTVEMHGALPLDCETVTAEAYALKMAEAVDGLVLDNLPYFYAGATVIGRGTVQVSIRQGIDYLYGIAKSLLRQGFRRQIYLSFHGPAERTCGAVVRDFFDETKVQALYLDVGKATMQGNPAIWQNAMESINDIFVGSYEVLGKLEQVPLTTGKGLDPADRSASASNRERLTPGGVGEIGFYFERKEDHAPTPNMWTAEERSVHAQRGVALIEETVAKLDMPSIVRKMQEWQAFHDTVVFPKYRQWLP